MNKRSLYIAFAVSLLVLLWVSPTFTSDVSAFTCNVPTGVPDVSTALSLGCNEIIFTGDVVDTGQATVTGVGIGFTDIILRGNGHSLVITPFSPPYISLQDISSLRIYNLDIQIRLGSGTIFDLVNTSLYLANVSISSTLTGTVFSQTTYNVSAYLSNVNASNMGSYSTFLYQYSFPPVSGPRIHSNTIGSRINISGYSYALSSLIMGNYSLENVWTDGATILQPYIMDSPSGMVSIENYNASLDPSSPVLYPLSINQAGNTGSLAIDIENLSIVGPFQDGLSIMFRNRDATNISLFRAVISNPALSGQNGIYIFNMRGTGTHGPVRMNISSVYVSGVEYGVAMGNVVTFPTPLGPIEEAYYYLDNSTIEASLVGVILTTTLNSEAYALIRDTVVESGGYGIIYYTLDEASIRIVDTNTSSVLEGLYLFLINYDPTTPRIDLETMWWFDERLSSYPYSFSIVEYPFYDGSPSVFFNISYSLIDRFDASMGSGVLYETVYNPYGSLGSPRSIWTLNVQVLSSYTGLPVSGLRIDYWEDGVYVGSAFTGGDGNSYFTFDYIFDPADPFIQDLVFTISTSYFSGSWSYRLDFGILTTLPSWYDKIILYLPILAIKAYGMLDHIPAVMTVMGDSGVILLFADSGSMIRFLFGDRDVPYKLVRVRILDMTNYGIYIVAEAVLENHLPWSQPVRMWILPGQGILRIHGPADAIFYLVGR